MSATAYVQQRRAGVAAGTRVAMTREESQLAAVELNRARKLLRRVLDKDLCGYVAHDSTVIEEIRQYLGVA